MHLTLPVCIMHRSQNRVSLKDQVADGLKQHLVWKLSCYSVAESNPEDFSYQPRVANEVTGDVSVEEVRWVDYQEPNKHICAARFAEANRLKVAQFEVSHDHTASRHGWHTVMGILAVLSQSLLTVACCMRLMLPASEAMDDQNTGMLQCKASFNTT